MKRKFNKRQSIVDHINLASSYKCNFCYRKFVRVSSLIEHEENNHKQEVTAAYSECLDCQICRVKFTRKGALERHRVFEHSVKTTATDDE